MNVNRQINMRTILPIQALRQLMFPRELRIQPSGYPEEVREQLTRAIEHFMKNWPPPVGPPPPPPTDPQRLLFLTDVATGLWRMRRSMVPTNSVRLVEARPVEEMRKPFRWLISIWDVLKANGLEIQDHTGDRFDSGQALKAPAFEPTPGLKEETVISTIKPSIYFDGKMIQVGEVVVGTPETPASEQAKSSSSPSSNNPKKPPPGKSYFAT